MDTSNKATKSSNLPSPGNSDTKNKSQNNSINKFLPDSCHLSLLILLNKSNEKIISSILVYLEYKEIQKLQRANKYLHSILNDKKILRDYALSGVISKENRILFYESQINLKELKNSLLKELIDYNITTNIYSNILQKALDLKEKDQKFMRVIDDISCDINRTFNTEIFVSGNGKIMLKNILTSLAFIRPEIGYCQGMNFIVGALINFIDNEEKCFWIFLSFIDNIELSYLYLKNMPDYSIRVFQLNYYIKEYFPQLFIHLKKNQINPDVIFSKWILTIFSNFLPFSILYNVWDVFILDKWKAIFKFSLVLADYLKNKLISMDLIALSAFIKKIHINISELNFIEIAKDYKKYKITNKKLNELREEFFVEQLKSKLEARNTKWETDQSDYVNNYHSEIEKINNDLQTSVENLKEEIKQANLDYEKKAKKYEEHLDIVNQLKIKLGSKIEEKASYENALKRYKNMHEKKNSNLCLSCNQENKNSNKKKTIFGLKKINKVIKARLSSHLKKIIKIDNDEKSDIEIKINILVKEIENNNQTLLDEYSNLDRKKLMMEKAEGKKSELKKQLDDILTESEKAKKEAIKVLSEKLKLSEKFVATNQY